MQPLEPCVLDSDRPTRRGWLTGQPGLELVSRGEAHTRPRPGIPSRVNEGLVATHPEGRTYRMNWNRLVCPLEAMICRVAS